jgi:hypothetical protein
MSRVEQNIGEVERRLARQRMILEQLRIHLEGLTPRTSAAIHASLLVEEATEFLHSLQEKKCALLRRAGRPLLH